MGELPTGYICYPEDPDYEMAFMREKAERERDHARAGLREIQELHRSIPCEPDCCDEGLCWTCADTYPCSTRQLADKALGGAS